MRTDERRNPDVDQRSAMMKKSPRKELPLFGIRRSLELQDPSQKVENTEASAVDIAVNVEDIMGNDENTKEVNEAATTAVNEENSTVNVEDIKAALQRKEAPTEADIATITRRSPSPWLQS